MKKLITLLVVLCIQLNSLAQQTYVPDDNFEQALINLGYDSVLDDFVPTLNIQNIISLDISYENIVDLTGIEGFVNLEELNCNGNDLTILDISSNINLTNLNCRNNNLITLDVSTNTLLDVITCSSNNLTTLNLNNNTILEYLYCSSNNIESLNLSMIPTLIIALCNSNNLSYLNIKNGNNTNIFFFWTLINPNLTCVEVDDVNYSTTNWTTIDSQTSFSENCNYGITYIPDDNFEQALIDLGYDAGVLNGYVLTSNIENRPDLDIRGKNIENLTGIEGFTSLQHLFCNNNQLNELILTENNLLTYVFCDNNNLEKLVIKNVNLDDFGLLLAINNPNLNCIEVDDVNHWNNESWNEIDEQTYFSEISCELNRLTYMPDNNFEDYIETTYGNSSDILDDNFVRTDIIENITTLNIPSKNIENLRGIEDFTSLERLYCYFNELTTLDLSTNTQLEYLNCNSNQLTSLNISANSVLRYLYCVNNQLTELDLSANTELGIFYGNFNQLTTIDLSSNTQLHTFALNFNQLIELDLSANTLLQRISCQSNQLTTLNVKNGNNINVTNNTFRVSNNPNLTCIEVDDENYSTANWTYIDANANFSENCHYDETYVPDNNFEQTLINLGYDTVLDDYVLTSNIENVISLNLKYDNISDATGLEDFTNLQNLYCRNNNLTTLDVSQNLALRKLECEYNQLTTLDLSTNINLIKLRCNNNQLVNLNLSNSEFLEILYCYFNNIVHLDISQNFRLRDFSASFNELESLTIDNNSNTSNSIYFINQFNLLYNPNLTCVQVNDADWSIANWSNKDSQIYYNEDSCIPSKKNTMVLSKNKITEKLILSNSNNSNIRVKTKNNSKIVVIKIFDVLGKLIIDLQPNQIDFVIPTNIHRGTILFVKAKLENGNILNTKFIKL